MPAVPKEWRIWVRCLRLVTKILCDLQNNTDGGSGEIVIVLTAVMDVYIQTRATPMVTVIMYLIVT